MINWTSKTKEEYELISKIAKRAVAEGVNCYASYMDLTMDIEAVYQTCGLRLKDLLEADKFNFLHDIYGIASNLNRETGELKNCFLPRYAA